MSSGTGVMLGMDRRRAGSIGIEEKALTTLERFVELCDTGYVDDDEVDEVTGNVLDSLTTAAVERAGGRDLGGGGIINSGTVMGKTSIFSSQKKPIPDISLSQNKAKLCELFIDRSLVEMKTKTNGTMLVEKSNSKNGNSGKTSPGTQKKSEEIWVKRVTDPTRRSFRVSLNFLIGSV